MECHRVKCDPTEIQIINSFRAQDFKEILFELEGTSTADGLADEPESFRLLG